MNEEIILDSVGIAEGKDDNVAADCCQLRCCRLSSLVNITLSSNPAMEVIKSISGYGLVQGVKYKSNFENGEWEDSFLFKKDMYVSCFLLDTFSSSSASLTILYIFKYSTSILSILHD